MSTKKPAKKTASAIAEHISTFFNPDSFTEVHIKICDLREYSNRRCGVAFLAYLTNILQNWNEDNAYKFNVSINQNVADGYMTVSDKAERLTALINKSFESQIPISTVRYTDEELIHGGSVLKYDLVSFELMHL